MFHGNRLIKSDKSFNVQWAFTYGNIQFSHLLLSKTGAMYFLGSTVASKTNIIGRINSNGTLSWAKDIQTVNVLLVGNSPANFSMDAYSLMLDGMNNLLISGSENTIGPPAKGFLLKTDTNGAILKYKPFNVAAGSSGLTGLSIVSDSLGFYKLIGSGYLSVSMSPSRMFTYYVYNDNTDVFTKAKVLFNEFPYATMDWNFVRSKGGKLHALNLHQLNNTSNNRASILKVNDNGQAQSQITFTKALGIASEVFGANVLEINPNEFVCELNTNSYFFPFYSSAVFKIDSNNIASTNGMYMLQNHNCASNLNNIKSNHPQYISNGKNYFDVVANSYPLNQVVIQQFNPATLSYSCSLNATCTAVTNVLSVPNQTLNLPVNYVVVSYNVSNLAVVETTSLSTIALNYCTLMNIDEKIFNNSIVVLPNPAHSKIVIHSNEKVESVEVYDISGKLISTQSNTNEIDVSELMQGMYFLQLNFGNEIVRKKFIKQ